MTIRHFLLSIIFFLTSTLYGLSFDTVVPFSGSSNPSGKFYTKIWGDQTLILGVSSLISGQRDEEPDLDLLIGFQQDVSFFGELDLIGVFNRYVPGDESISPSDNRSSLRLEKISVTKKWLYPFNEYIELGVQLGLIDLYLDGTNRWGFIPSYEPVLAAKIRF